MNAVQYNFLLHAALLWLKQITQSTHMQNTHHILRSQTSYGMSVVGILEKTDCVITASYCLYVDGHTQQGLDKGIRLLRMHLALIRSYGEFHISTQRKNNYSMCSTLWGNAIVRN